MPEFLMPDLSSVRWYLHGSCARSLLASEAWFPLDPIEPAAGQARAVCRRCKVRGYCLADALATPGIIGIWGGLDDHERRSLEVGR